MEKNLSPPTHDPKDFIPVHFGLMGHIDAGKTALARKMTEIISTSGLDKHPQSQKRGITIDLGFTFFPLENYMVTLVDAPGHADLIKSVVSGANIIDAALLVIDAVEGPQVQTGEHLLILDLLGIQSIIVVVNKIDKHPDLNREKISQQVSSLIKNTRFNLNSSIVFTSAITGEGIQDLKDHLMETIQAIDLQRHLNKPLLYLIDHHFGKKGQGTIVTGTVLSGKATIGDALTLLPLNRHTKIKSIQKWKQSVDILKAGDRCGILLTELTPKEIFRGCILTNSTDQFVQTQWIVINFYGVTLFSHACKFGQEITINHRMQVLRGRIFPFKEVSINNSTSRLWYSPSIRKKEFKAVVWFESSEYLQKGDQILFTRLDLSPKSLRIMGKGIVNEIISPPILFYKEKTKIGIIKHPTYSENSIIVANLAQSRRGAETLLQKSVQAPVGKIMSAFGQKGNVEIRLENPKAVSKNFQKGDQVILKEKVPFEIKPYKSYEFLRN